MQCCARDLIANALGAWAVHGGLDFSLQVDVSNFQL
jgi:hypothetical protein